MQAGRIVRAATWAGCAIGTALAFAGLAGFMAGSVALPLGPNGGLRLALDAVSAPFLLIVCVSGAVAALDCDTPLLPAAVGAMAVTLCAADGFTFVLAFASASAAAWALNRAARPQSGPAGALLSQGMAALAVYASVRVLFDLCGPAVPGWWGLPLLALGAAGTVWGGLRANAADDLLAILAASRVGAIGLIAVGLGVALEARGSDLAPLAALALAGALLHAISYAVFDILLVLCADAVSRGAGTPALSQLGGLLRTMPGVGLGALAGAACLAGLPLTAGFTGRWLVVQSLLADQRLGGFWLQVAFALALAAVALGAALAAAAAVRLIGIGFLGRPRTPQAAAAEDAPRQVRLAMACLAACCLLIGLWPSAALALVQPALWRLLGTGMAGGGLVVISPQVNSPGYAAPGIAAVLAISAVAAAAAMSRLASGNAMRARRVPAWDGGRESVPPPMAFGDPATQYSAASAGQALLQTLLQTLGYPALWPGLKRWAKAAKERSAGTARVKSAGALLLVLAGLLLWAFI